MQQVVGRFAPTPSGRMHLGNVFSCLMAWLAARSAGGKVVLRIEDLDPRAQDPRNARLLMDDLAWLGLEWDEGPYFQSNRSDVYAQAIEELNQMGVTYPCFCTRSQLHAASAPHASDGTYVYQGTCRNLTRQQREARALSRRPALRLLVPASTDDSRRIDFDDLVFGAHHEDLALECGDFLVQRSDGVVAYQLAVVVDDALMGINQVVRGRDLLGSVARQVYLQKLLNYETPSYGHVPLLVSADGRRLSKRDRDLDIGVLRNAGAKPCSIIGVLAESVGLAEAGERVTAEDLIPRFSWETIRKHRDDIQIPDNRVARILESSR